MSGAGLYRDTVRAEWVDYNGHMSEAYYVLVFGFATDALYERLNMGEDYRARTACSLYTAESHVRYLRETGEGVSLGVESWLLGADAKRLHFAHQMSSDDRILATAELMAVHVNTNTGLPLQMGEPELAGAREALVTEAPDWIGRSIRTLEA